MQNRIKINTEAQVIFIIILISQLFFLNGIYLFACMLCLYIGFFYLQQPFKSSIFTIIFIYHILQISAGVWQATYLDSDINYRSSNMGLATILSLAGLLVMFAPIIYFQNKIPKITIEILKKHAYKFSTNKSLYVYIAAFFISGALNGVRFILPGYTQFIITLVNLKWFFFLLFGFQAVLKKERRKEFYFFIGLEFVLGLSSFFSDFKMVLFFIAALYLTFIIKINLKQILLLLIVVFFAFYGSILWTTVKGEYRNFLNGGEKSQNVSVSQNEALTKLYELTNNKEKEAVISSTARFLDRLQGTYFLSRTMDRVPAVLPFQNGSNWGETFAFVFTPRLFNPDKPELDESKKVSKYTGIRYAGLSQGTSFSLGYFADCYIDFGIFGMFLPLLIIGLLYGTTYFYFLRNSTPNYIFNFSIVCSLYMRYFGFEMDSVFFTGSLFTDLIIYFLLSKFFFPWLYRFLLQH